MAFFSEDSQRTISWEADLLGGRKELRLGDLVEHEDLSVIEGSESLGNDSVDQCMKSWQDCLQLRPDHEFEGLDHLYGKANLTYLMIMSSNASLRSTRTIRILSINRISEKRRRISGIRLPP